jgi:hypothetical protein
MRAARSLPVVLLATFAACADEPTPAATGELGAWTAGPALPTARANHCTAVAGDWLLVIGGNHADSGGFTATDEIHAARMSSDGTLSPWQLAGHTASGVTECAATLDPATNTLYIVDGIYTNDTDGGAIFTAAFDPATGLVSPVTRAATLPTRTLSTEVAIAGSDLLVMDTRLPNEPEGDTTVLLRAPLADLGSWTTVDWHIGFRAQSEYAFADTGAVYTLGGYHDTGIGATSDVFALANDAISPEPALPAAVAFGEAVAVDSWLFVIGGRAQIFGAPGTQTIYAAPLADDGTLGAWSTSATPLPMPRTNHEVSLVGDYLVLTGGASEGGGDTTVVTSRVRWSR